MAEDDDRFDLAMGALSLAGSDIPDDEDDQEDREINREIAICSIPKSSKCDGKTSLIKKGVEFSNENEDGAGPIDHIDKLPMCLLRKILSYLRMWELSPCRLVSKRWNDQILNHTSYPQKSFILLTFDRVISAEEGSSSVVFSGFDSFDPVFRRVRMLRVAQHQLINCLSPTFAENVAHLELFHCGPITWTLFLDLMIACHRLEELTVRKCPFKWPYDIEEWKNKHIEWLAKIQRCGNCFPDLKAIEFRVKDPHDVLYMWKLVLKYSTRLQRMSFSCKSPVNGLKLDSGIDDMDDMYETVIELFDIIVEIVNRFGKGMELFHSYLIDPPQQKGNNSICSRSTVNLNKCPDFTIMNLYCSDVLSRLNSDDLDLKSFCLYGGEISAGNIPQQTDILGNFLKSQKNLEKVILPRMRFNSAKEFEQLLRNIPKTVKCIRVPTFGQMPDCLSFEFYRLKEYYIEAHGTPDLQIIVPPGTILPNVKTFSFYNCSDWVWQTVKIMTVINSFPCLTELLIRDDGTHQCTRIGDSDLQNICRFLPNLKKLHMTNVDCVTDFGFSGICEKECRLMNETGKYVPSPGTKIGYSVSALKQLEYLCLSNIGFRVTNVSMIYGFTFLNLRFMTLEGYPKVTPWGVECLKKNNSKLKRWNLQFHDSEISLVVERLQSTPQRFSKCSTSEE